MVGGFQPWTLNPEPHNLSTTKIVPFGPAVQFLLYVSENVLYIDIIEPVGGSGKEA